MEIYRQLPEKYTVSTPETTGLKLTFAKTTDENDIRNYFALLENEFVSKSGNIRDIDISSLKNLANNGSEIWIAKNHNLQVVAGHTLTPINGCNLVWWYLNHGVVTKTDRGQGVNTRLINTTINSHSPESKFIVITVAEKPFLRCGFDEINLEQLQKLNSNIYEFIFPKIRNGVISHICIKT